MIRIFASIDWISPGAHPGDYSVDFHTWSLWGGLKLHQAHCHYGIWFDSQTNKSLPYKYSKFLEAGVLGYMIARTQHDRTSETQLKSGASPAEK